MNCLQWLLPSRRGLFAVAPPTEAWKEVLEDANKKTKTVEEEYEGICVQKKVRHPHCSAWHSGTLVDIGWDLLKFSRGGLQGLGPSIEYLWAPRDRGGGV